MKYRSTPGDISGRLGLNLLYFTQLRTTEGPKSSLGYSLSRFLAGVYFYRLDGRYSHVGGKYRSMPRHISGHLRIVGG